MMFVFKSIKIFIFCFFLGIINFFLEYDFFKVWNVRGIGSCGFFFLIKCL